MRTSLIGISLFLILLGAAGDAWPGSALPLDPEKKRHELASRTEILEDPYDAFGIKAVSAKETMGFTPNRGTEISIGRSASTFWLRFKLKPTTPLETFGTWFLEVGKPGIGAIDLYVPQLSGDDSPAYLQYRSGSLRRPSENDVLSRTTVLELPHTWASDHYFYLKVKSGVALNFPLRVWSPKGFISGFHLDNYGFGILFGLLIGMILFNLTLYIYLRDRIYLYYALYMSSILWCETLLYGQFEAFFDLDRKQMGMLFFLACGSAWFFGGFFSRRFLNTKTYAPVFDRIFMGIIAGSLVVPALGFAGLDQVAHRANEVLGIIASPATIAAAVVVWRQKFPPARYFLAAWLILIAGIFLYSIGGTFIPRSPMTVYTLAVGSGIESILLSLALADRIRLLRKEKEYLRQNERRLRVLAVTDGLTGLYNKRFMLDTLERETALARENGTPLCLLIMDVDNFKNFNDTYGHPEGDKVLIELAGILHRQVRDKDSPCRYGGEEFVVILPLTGTTDARGVAERIRTSLSDISFQPRPDTPARVTLSLGLAELKPGETSQDLVRRADEALYKAKHSGKNRVISV